LCTKILHILLNNILKTDTSLKWRRAAILNSKYSMLKKGALTVESLWQEYKFSKKQLILIKGKDNGGYGRGLAEA